MYTYHKYQKSIATPLQSPEDESHAYASLAPPSSGVPLENLDTPNTYPPLARETTEDRTQRLRDEFEGWGSRASSTWSISDDGEVEEEEVERRMSERDGKGVTVGTRGKWGEWWAKEM